MTEAASTQGSDRPTIQARLRGRGGARGAGKILLRRTWWPRPSWTSPASRRRRGEGARPRLRHDRRPCDLKNIVSSTRAKPSISARPAAAPNSPPIPQNISTTTSRRPKCRQGTIYTCPMHPQIRQVGPGSCPICGMALEPEVASLDAPPNPELADMTRRFWIGRCCRCPRSSWRWAAIWSAVTTGSTRRCRTGSSSCSRHPWCSGRAGRSSSAAGNRWSRAISTCSR